MPGRRNGRRNGRGGAVRRVHNEVAQLRKELNGHKAAGHVTNPPPVNERPYYPLRISMDLPDSGTEYYFTVKEIIGRVAGQLGLTDQTTAILNVKVQSVYGWAYMYGSSTDRIAMSGSVSSVIPTFLDSDDHVTDPIHYPIIYKFSDFGTLNRPAHFGYVWPKSMQQIPLTKNSNFTVLACTQNSSNATVHFNVLWSTGDVAPKPVTLVTRDFGPWTKIG